MKDIQPIILEGVNTSEPLVIAGPCSAETEEQVLETATQLAANGIKIFRAGIWKPRKYRVVDVRANTATTSASDTKNILSLDFSASRRLRS